MITAVAARWLLTVAFAAAGLGAALPRRGTADAADRVPAVYCAVMCAALIAMIWRSESAAAAWAQAAVFGCAALWFWRARPVGTGGARRPGLPAVLHTLMAVAMIWMLTVMPASTGMPTAGPGRGATMAMQAPAGPAPVLAVSILLAAACSAACIRRLTRAVGPGHRAKDPVSVSQAVMSAGMAAMLLVTL